MRIRLCRIPILSYLLFYIVPAYIFFVAISLKSIYLICSGQVSVVDYKDFIIFLFTITLLFIVSCLLCFIIWRIKGKFLLIVYPNGECKILNKKNVYLSFKLENMEINYEIESFALTLIDAVFDIGIARITIFPDCLDRKNFYFGVNRFLVRRIKKRLNIIKKTLNTKQ